MACRAAFQTCSCGFKPGLTVGEKMSSKRGLSRKTLAISWPRCQGARSWKASIGTSSGVFSRASQKLRRDYTVYFVQAQDNFLTAEQINCANPLMSNERGRVKISGVPKWLVSFPPPSELTARVRSSKTHTNIPPLRRAANMISHTSHRSKIICAKPKTWSNFCP